MSQNNFASGYTSDKIKKLNELLKQIEDDKVLVVEPSQIPEHAALDKINFESKLEKAKKLLYDIEIDNYIYFAGTLRGTTRLFRKRFKVLFKI